MTDLKNDGIVLVLRSVEMILRVLPTEGATLLQPLLPGMMKVVAEGDKYPMVMSMYLSVVARLVLYAEPIFTWIVNQVCLVIEECCCCYFKNLFIVLKNKLSIRILISCAEEW